MNYYNLQYTPRRVRRKKVKILAFLLLSGVVMPFILLQYMQHRADFVPRAETLAITIAPTISPTIKVTNSTALGQVVRSELEGTTGTYSVVVNNLKTNEAYYINEHEAFQAGSLYKLWVMAVAYEQIQKGTLPKDELLKSDVKALNEKFKLASGSAELQDGEVVFTVKQALDQMITISHNYAALILAQRIKLSNVETFLKTQGLWDSKIGQPPMTTAYDISKFYEDLYTGKLADQQHTQEMLDLLKRQRLNGKLPKYLPQGTVIAHKTGELGFVTHDSGIVFTEKGDYIIVVMSESSFPQGAEERIAEVSRGVFEYFSSR